MNLHSFLPWYIISMHIIDNNMQKSFCFHKWCDINTYANQYFASLQNCWWLKYVITTITFWNDFFFHFFISLRQSSRVLYRSHWSKLKEWAGTSLKWNKKLFYYQKRKMSAGPFWKFKQWSLILVLEVKKLLWVNVKKKKSKERKHCKFKGCYTWSVTS